MRRKIHPSWCFYAGVLGIIVGIIISICSERIIAKEFFWIVVAVVIFVFSLQYARLWTIGLALIAGLIIGNFRCETEIFARNYFRELSGSNVVISGRISDDPTFSDSKISLRLDELKVQVLQTEAEDIVWQEVSGTAYIGLSGKKVELERSDLVTLEGKLGDGFGNFVTSMYRPKISGIERAEIGDLPAKLKHWFADTVRKVIPSPEAELGLGYLVGMKSGLPESLSTTLQTVGMTHVVVASGAHLGILVSAAKKIFGRVSKFASVLFSSLLILSFALVIGFTPSMTRAAMVASFSLIAGYFGRKWSPLRLLLFVGMLTLMINPTYLVNLGWQLSFASFFGILIVGPALQKILYGGKHPPWLAGMLITSFATSIICAPILIYNFGSLSLLSFVANLFILPTLPYAMLAVFLSGVTGGLAIIGNLTVKIATLILDFHLFVVNFLSEKTMFIFELPSANPLIFLLYLPVILCLICPRIYRFCRLLLANNNKKCYNIKYES